MMARENGSALADAHSFRQGFRGTVTKLMLKDRVLAKEAEAKNSCSDNSGGEFRDENEEVEEGFNFKEDDIDETPSTGCSTRNTTGESRVLRIPITPGPGERKSLKGLNSLATSLRKTSGDGQSAVGREITSEIITGPVVVPQTKIREAGHHTAQAKVLVKVSEEGCCRFVRIVGNPTFVKPNETKNEATETVRIYLMEHI